MKNRLKYCIAALAALFVHSLVAGPVPAAATRLQAIAADHDGDQRVYIVQLAAPPAVAEPRLRKEHRKGRRARLETRSPAVERYAERLVAQHDATLARVGVRDAKLYSYRYALNGFSARMTPAQAHKLRAQKGVLKVWEDRKQQVKTNDSPGFLGLTAREGGLWKDRGLRGEGVVIGVIDSGIAPGHISFKDTIPAKRPRVCRSAWAENSLLGLWLCKRFKSRPDQVIFATPASWQGQCQAGEGFATTDCNNKLIGARYYIDGFLDEYTLDDNEFISPKDADGHGTHIASVAAGNPVSATLGGEFVDKISGMAPRAHVAVYKACWLEPGELRGTCSTADLTQAIEDAVADGVDIINYSVGSDDDIVDADDLALLAAVDAGVLVVGAAGNEGPAPESVVSPAAAPWVLAVGASSRRGERFRDAIRVNSPASVQKDYVAVEAAFTPRLRDKGLLTLDLVLVDDGVFGFFDGLIGTTFDACESVRNASELSGKIALVQRGGCNFDVKVRNVQDAGAKAALVFSDQGEPLLMNGSRNGITIPALMIGHDDGELLRARLEADETVGLTLQKGLFLTVADPGNRMEAFSARGPNSWQPDVLKPDLTAPGVDILGAQTPDVANNLRGETFQYLSGTSMAVPHVAGLSALLKEAHPDWSPAALRSALITTARQDVLNQDGETPADPFDFGAGHVVPNAAFAPGLVYDAGAEDYDAFLCGRDQPRDSSVDCERLEADGLATDGSDLNLPTIATDDLVSEQVIRRRVTNVGEAAQFVARVEMPTTIDAEIVPPLLSLDAGESADFEIRLSADATTFDAWQFGALTWTSGATAVRSPLAIRALRFAAPVFVAGSGTEGSLDVALRSGYTGPYRATLSGLEAANQGQPDELRAALSDATVGEDFNDSYSFIQPGSGSLPASVRRIRIIVPEGTRYLRVALNNEARNGDADLDLYLYACPGFGSCTDEATPSQNDDADEAINLIPAEGENYVAPGEYFVDVHGFDTDGGSATFNLLVWTVGADRANATLSVPGSLAAGGVASAVLSWQALPAGLHLGLIDHSDGEVSFGQTIVEVMP
ncbi:MAG: S8 family serine peptidase [Chromatiales bacterium]|nr:S8 family serine peptidase [Chromatiales bacterium]